MGKLNALQVDKATKRGLYGDGDGLYLQVTESGNKSWIFRYRVEGKLRNHGLGPVKTLSLAEAREAARRCRKLRLDGIDPIEAKKQQRAAKRLEDARSISFDDCAASYIETHRAGWKNAKHAAQWASTLETYVSPVFGTLPVADIDVTLVLKALEPIWTLKPETAGRVRGRIEAILDWAKVRGYRAGENPARWRGNLSHTLPSQAKVRKVKHRPALPYGEIGAFWIQLADRSGVSVQALRFTILTAARSGEVLGARWEEIDMDSATWTIPEDRMKAGKEHRVPLTDQAIAILKGMKKTRQGNFVFPGGKAGRPLSDMAMTKVLRDMGRDDITVHGFRSTFRDWAADCTDFPREVAEAALAHTLENKVEAAYRRSDLFDKRRDLMEAWAKQCAESPKMA